MKIAYFVHEFPSLSETFVLNQITGLIDRGHDLRVFARLRGGAPHQPDIERYALLERTSYWPVLPRNFYLRAAKAAGLLLAHGWRAPRIALRALNRRRFGRVGTSLELPYAMVPLLRAGDYDVACAHFAPNAVHAAALRALGALRGKLTATFHDLCLTRYLQKWGPGVYRQLFEVADLIFVTSEDSWRRLLKVGCPPEKIRVHRMGVDCERFAARRDDESERKPVRLLSVGRLVEKKGFEYGVRAVAELKSRGVGCSYEIVGGGPLLGELQDLIEALDLSDRVRMLGPQTQDQILPLLCEADIFVAPSVTACDGDEEVIPIAIMEAMASSLPVVSTRHAAIPELLEDGVSGWLVPPRDALGLADRLAELILDRSRRRAMGAAGRSVALRRSNVKTLNDELAAVFAKLVS